MLVQVAQALGLFGEYLLEFRQVHRELRTSVVGRLDRQGGSHVDNISVLVFANIFDS